MENSFRGEAQLDGSDDSPEAQFRDGNSEGLEERDDEERSHGHHEQQIDDDGFDSNDEESEEEVGLGDADDVDIADTLFQLCPLVDDETQQPTDERAPVGDGQAPVGDGHGAQTALGQGTTVSHPFEDQKWLIDKYPSSSAGTSSGEIDQDRQSAAENLYKPFTSEMDWEIAEWTKTYGIPSRALNALLAKRGVSLLSSRECNESLTKAYSSLITLASHIKIHENSITSLIASFQDDHVSRHRISRYTVKL